MKEVFSVLKGALTSVAAEMVGYRALTSHRKGSTWLTDQIKEAIEEKRAYKKMLQRNVEVVIRVRCRTYYSLLNRKVKELVKRSKGK